MADEQIPQSHPIVTQPKARALGLKRYFTGGSCKRGHISERYTNNGACAECDNARVKKALSRKTIDKARERRAEIRRTNGDAIRAEERAYREANLERTNARAARNMTLRRQRTPEKVKAEAARWRQKNREGSCLRTKQWRAENPELAKAAAIRWVKMNPERYKAHMRAAQATRRAKKAANGGSFTAAQVDELFIKQRKRCANCRTSIAKRFHADHITPIAKGGGSNIANIQLLCPLCNQRKHTKDAIDWAREQGRLL